MWTWEIPSYFFVGGLAGGAGILAMPALLLQRSPWLDGLGVASGALRIIVRIGCGLSALFGAALATYTGVLIGATAVPAWHTHHRLLPTHFGVAGLGSAAALFELAGFDLPALWALGLLAAASETLISAWVEVRRHGARDLALRQGLPAWLLRGSGLLAGPLALTLRLTGFTNPAALAFLLGVLVSRYGWLYAGRVSARDPEAALARGGEPPR